MQNLGKYLQQVMNHYHGIYKNTCIELWTQSERRWMRSELNIIDPKQYWDLSMDELDDYGVSDLKHVLRWFGRKVTVNNATVNGLVNAKLALQQYKLIKPRLVRAAYHVKQLDQLHQINRRINVFWSGVSQSSFVGYTEIAQVFKLILVEANQTDGNERCNWKRKKLVNEFGNLENINDRMRLIKNGPDPHSSDAYKLYVETLKVFNNKNQ